MPAALAPVPATAPAPFAWSYSKLKNYETCPLRYSETDLKKSTNEPKSQELDRGEQLHEAMRKRINSDTPLPPNFIYMEPWAVKLAKVIHPFQIVLTELKLAVNAEGKPVGFFDKKVWLRGVVDYLRIVPTTTPGRDIGQIVDYKTGRPKDDWTQLMLSAYLVFCHYSSLQEVRTQFLWTEYNDTSHEDFKRSDMAQAIAGIIPRIKKMEFSVSSGEYEPTPNGLCKEYCGVTQCQFHGKPYRKIVR